MTAEPWICPYFPLTPGSDRPAWHIDGEGVACTDPGLSSRRQAWDLAVDICLSQLPTIIEEGTAFRVSISLSTCAGGCGGGSLRTHPPLLLRRPSAQETEALGDLSRLFTTDY